MNRFWIGVSAAALAAGGCDRGPELPGDKGADQVAPKEVSPEELRAAVTDPRVRSFYEARGWKAAWNEDQARSLAEALRQAPSHGLEAVQFLKDGDSALDPVAREAALSEGAISYAAALSNGRIDPRTLWKDYSVPMPRIDLIAGLNQAIETGDVGSWLAGLAPQDAEYQALSKAFLHHSRQARGTTAPIPAGRTIAPGARDPRIPAIAEALRSGGYLDPAAPGEAASDRHGPAIVAAVKRLQSESGAKADGAIGPATLALINGGGAERARTLAINLERRRWLERKPPETRIDVNTAAAFLDYWRGGERADSRRVVVGQPDWETPPLGSPITRLVANPPWNVPQSIEQDELLAKGADYLARNGFSRVDGRLVQKPGPEAALGLVKFDMDNPHAIYLHDTPAKALFATDQRHSSHGCVRVHNAIEFARLLARDQGALEAFDKALQSGKESPVALKNAIPVRLLYHTAFVEDGRVRFAADPYGWDETLARALGLGSGTRQRVRTHVSVMGP